MPPPRVTVVIPTFNRVRFLPSAVRSALDQTLLETEVVIVDDGSTDSTPAVCSSLAARDQRVRVIRQPNRGLASARNTGLAAAKAEWIAFLDDDDLWVADALAVMLGNVSDDDAVAGLCRRFDSEDPDLVAATIVANPARFHAVQWPPGAPPPTITLKEILLRPLIPIPAALFRRSRLIALGGFDENLAAGEDYDLWLRWTASTPVRVVPSLVALVRSHQGQMSADLGRQAHETRRALEAFLTRHPEAWIVAGRSRLRRRLAALAQEEAYAALLARDRAAAGIAAWRSIRWYPGRPKAWLYLGLAPRPSIHTLLRRLGRRIK